MLTMTRRTRLAILALALTVALAAAGAVQAATFFTVWAFDTGRLTCKSLVGTPVIDVTYRSASEVEFICKAY